MRLKSGLTRMARKHVVRDEADHVLVLLTLFELEVSMISTSMSRLKSGHYVIPRSRNQNHAKYPTPFFTVFSTKLSRPSPQLRTSSHLYSSRLVTLPAPVLKNHNYWC